jgi:Chlorophyll A-B binding protein
MKSIVAAVVVTIVSVQSFSSVINSQRCISLGRSLSKLHMSDPSSPADSAVNTFASDSPLKSKEGGDLEIDLDSLANESASATFTTKTDISSMYVAPESRKTPRMAQWFPMLLSPQSLDGTYAGDVGFDPLNLSGGGRIVSMREAEVKHARLAMLAAAGWPMSELWHKNFAELLGLDSLLVNDRAPSVLNGGLSNEWIVLTAVFTLIIGGLLEFKSFEMSKKDNYKPGDYGFDPLGLYAVRASFGLDQVQYTDDYDLLLNHPTVCQTVCSSNQPCDLLLTAVEDKARRCCSP